MGYGGSGLVEAVRRPAIAKWHEWNCSGEIGTFKWSASGDVIIKSKKLFSAMVKNILRSFSRLRTTAECPTAWLGCLSIFPTSNMTRTIIYLPSAVRNLIAASLTFPTWTALQQTRQSNIQINLDLLPPGIPIGKFSVRICQSAQKPRKGLKKGPKAASPAGMNKNMCLACLPPKGSRRFRKIPIETWCRMWFTRWFRSSRRRKSRRKFYSKLFQCWE